jgi:polar amino acid transport system substrate-binding protein
MVDLARRIFQAEGHEVEYHQRPWVRALQETRDGAFHGVIGATRLEAPDFIFPDLAQGQMANAFWTLSDSSWQFHEPASLEGHYLAVIAGYSYGALIEGMLQDERHRPYITELHGVSPLKNGLKMLERGRIQVLLEDEHVMRYQLRQTGQTPQFKQAGSVPAQPESARVYIAFSPAHDASADYARLLTEGVARMRASGELASILADYGVSDWR